MENIYILFRVQTVNHQVIHQSIYLSIFVLLIVQVLEKLETPPEENLDEMPMQLYGTLAHYEQFRDAGHPVMHIFRLRKKPEYPKENP